MKMVGSLWVWSARDLVRHPLEAILTALTLISLIVVAGIPLLVSQGLSLTAHRILDKGPSMVVRRLMAGNWLPIPAEDAVKAAKSVTGVLTAKPRIWGVVTGSEQTVTIMGIQQFDEDSPENISRHFRKIIPGHAAVGPGVIYGEINQEMSKDLILINGHKRLHVNVSAVLPHQESMVAHDIIFLHEADAMNILGLESGFASDLAIEVFHEQEIDAIIPDLVQAFPWPVTITTKQDTLKMYTTSVDRRTGLVYLALIPSLLGLALIVVAGYRGTRSRFYESGLLKALGWTTRDIVLYFMCKALLIALPSLVLGMGAAYFLVFLPGISWPGNWFFGWTNNPPNLHLDSAGAFMLLIQVAGFIWIPYMVSNLWAAVENASADPYELLQAEGAL